MTKAFSYLRVSGLSQVGTKDKDNNPTDRDGFPRQSAAIGAFADKNGYEVMREFKEEGVSGRKDETERPAFMEMVAAILENGVRHVLVENLSRLAREFRIQEQLLIYLASKGIQLISCDTGENITEAMNGDPMRKAIVQMQAVFSELERSTLVRKLAAARKRKRDRGERCEGRKPYGTRSGEAEALAKMRELRRQGVKLVDIAMVLNSEGAPTRMEGARWGVGNLGRILARG